VKPGREIFQSAGLGLDLTIVQAATITDALRCYIEHGDLVPERIAVAQSLYSEILSMMFVLDRASGRLPVTPANDG
jgi:hypothetical protein